MNDGDLYLRHLVDAQHAVGVKVAFQYGAALAKRDLVEQNRAQTIARPAFDLRTDDVGVHGDTTIDSAPDLMDLGKPALIRHFDDLGHIGVKALVHGDAVGAIPLDLGAVPARKLGHFLQHATVATCVAFHQVQTSLNRVLGPCLEQLIQKHFGRIAGVRMTDRAPPKHRHGAVLTDPIDLKRRQIIRHFRRAFIRGRVHAVFHHCFHRTTGHDGLVHHHVMPTNDIAVCVQAALHLVHGQRTIIAAGHVIFSRPKQLP